MIQALVFDFDGLILDTETSVYEAWRSAFLEHGVDPPSLEVWSAGIGRAGGIEPLGLLQSLVPDLDVERMQARRKAVRDSLLETEEVIEGVEDWLRAASDLGLGLAVASSSSSEWVLGHLVRLGLRPHFAHVCCAEENGPLRSKPEPDLYLEACRLLGVDPGRALAVEDSPNGVAAAKAAGMWAVGVPRKVTAALDFSAADVVTPSLADLSLEAALAQL